MRLVITFAICAGSFFGLSKLPSEAELEQQMSDITDGFQAEIVASWNSTTTTTTGYTSTTSATAPTKNVSSGSIPTSTMSPRDFVCGSWSGSARSMGWSEEHLETLGQIAQAESGCNPLAHRTDTDGSTCSGDYGLLQINWTAWGERITALGYSCEDLYTPAVNLLVARWIVYEQAIQAGYRCGFQPWYSSGDYCK